MPDGSGQVAGPLALWLERCDPARRMLRFYSLEIVPDEDRSRCERVSRRAGASVLINVRLLGGTVWHWRDGKLLSNLDKLTVPQEHLA